MKTSVCGHCGHDHDAETLSASGPCLAQDPAMAQQCQCLLCPRPLPFEKTTSWSPVHVGRALAVAEAFPSQHTYGKVWDKEDRITVLATETSPDDNVYGSDVLNHLEMLARKETKE